uniref:Ubiquitin carboxyl-terminal hydrolase n=1 Tax=Phallusia mammillata TaxID=59560 RepID=A0A6F9DWY0_9ASCI|nr:ubiquitin carboxyl-terminal hydrolase 2 [Phallusia mammillata]
MYSSKYDRLSNQQEIMKYANQTSSSYKYNSYNDVYGPTANYIARNRNTSVLPTKPDVSSYTHHRDTTQSSPSYRRYTATSFATGKYDPSSYKASSYQSSSDQIVRPTTRARKGSFDSSSRSSSISPTGGSNGLKSYERKTSMRSPMTGRRSSSSSDILAQASDVPRSYTFNSVTAKKEAITIDKVPYDSEKYRPSFARTTSPKRAVDIDYGTHNGSSHSDIGSGNTGLRNIGNTCFMNSILQCLSNTQPLRDYCLTLKYETDLNREKSPMKGKLMTAFAELIQDLWKGKSMSISPNNFKSQIQKFSPRFMGYEQQDSQEFLRFLLEGLHEDINQIKQRSKEAIPNMARLRKAASFPLGRPIIFNPKEKARKTWQWYATRDRSFVYDLFVGQLESSLKCLECGHVSLTFDPFWDLSLPLSKHSYSSESTAVTDCLNTFTKKETLDRDEKPTCEECKTRRKMEKKLLIHKFPKILVIHLKRFNEGSRYRQKLTNHVKFPSKGLDLRNYASDQCENGDSAVYDLYAVSNHCGSCYGGHYTAHCCNPETKQWFEYNDSQVNSSSSSMICTKEAYVLFYTQRGSQSASRL